MRISAVCRQLGSCADSGPQGRLPVRIRAQLSTSGLPIKSPRLRIVRYDRLLEISLRSSVDEILGDLGAAQGNRMIPWFRDLYPVMQESGRCAI